MKETDFVDFPKLARLSREAIITEKIDGTNACIFIYPLVLEENKKDPNIITTMDGFTVRAGSREKWINLSEQDNLGFGNWVKFHAEELVRGLGEGRHTGEWWGRGIGRGYNMKEKVFSLFNVDRWKDDRPACCRVVPELGRGIFNTEVVDAVLDTLKLTGSLASPGFMNPEGVIVWHVLGDVGFKKTLDKHDQHKSAT